MNFSINKSDILGVLGQIQGIAGRKTSLAITTNVLIEATETGITLRSTDLETGYEGFFPANVQKSGSVAINARKFFEIVRDFPSEEIHMLEVENHWIEIGNRNVEYHLVGMNPEDFPEIPRFEDFQAISVDAAALGKMIERTVYISGASDDKRAHIIGLYLESIEAESKKFLRLVSTDGSRMAKVDQAYEGELGLPSGEGVLVPKKGMTEVGKFLDAEGHVQVGIKDNNLVVKKANETIIIRLLEGDFPEYGDILARSDEVAPIKLNRQLFLMMLKRMSILSTEDYRSVIFCFRKGQLVVTSTNPDIGESKEEMTVDFTKDTIQAAFNPRFFIEALNVIDEESVVLEILNDEKPCILAGEGETEFLTVIMPMRV